MAAMTRRLLAFAALAVSCGPASPFELPPLGLVPDRAAAVDAGTRPPADAGQLGTPVDRPLGGLPCEVKQVLEAHCTACHGGQLYVLHLTQAEDFRRERMQGKTVGQVAAKSPMPPYGHETQPTASEALVLINWVTSGMPEGTCGDAAGH